MIRFTYILVAGLLSINVSNAQSPQELKGPKAKNHKPWKQQTTAGPVTVTLGNSPTAGPAFKNKKPWKKQAEKVSISTEPRTKGIMMGPKAKNRKAWDKFD